MVKAVPVFLALVAGSTAWAEPVINANFVAGITGDADRSTLTALFDESSSVTVVSGSESFRLISDFAHSQLQFDFTSPDAILYQSPSPDTTGLFSEFLSATQLGSCSTPGRIGTLWESDPVSGPASSIDLCASGNTPLELIWNLGTQGDVTAVFNTFIPGIPPAADFNPTPEPASFPLAALAIAFVWWRRRSPQPGR